MLHLRYLTLATAAVLPLCSWAFSSSAGWFAPLVLVARALLRSILRELDNSNTAVGTSTSTVQQYAPRTCDTIEVKPTQSAALPWVLSTCLYVRYTARMTRGCCCHVKEVFADRTGYWSSSVYSAVLRVRMLLFVATVCIILYGQL